MLTNTNNNNHDFFNTDNAQHQGVKLFQDDKAREVDAKNRKAAFLSAQEGTDKTIENLKNRRCETLSPQTFGDSETRARDAQHRREIFKTARAQDLSTSEADKKADIAKEQKAEMDAGVKLTQLYPGGSFNTKTETEIDHIITKAENDSYSDEEIDELNKQENETLANLSIKDGGLKADNALKDTGNGEIGADGIEGLAKEAGLSKVVDVSKPQETFEADVLGQDIYEELPADLNREGITSNEGACSRVQQDGTAFLNCINQQ